MPIGQIAGRFLEWLRGPGKTTVYDGETVHRNVIVKFESDLVDYQISSKRIVYLTQFSRWWMPSIKRAIFHVEGKVLSGTAPENYQCSIAFPDMSSFGLFNTKYPHVRAIGAFLDAITGDATVVAI